MATWLGFVLFAFVLGIALGRFERWDRRIERAAPLELTPSLAQLRAWRAWRMRK